MRIIITCDPERFADALGILAAETARFDKYNRLGWGWSFGYNPSFFVRRIKNGLSVTQVNLPPKAPTVPVA